MVYGSGKFITEIFDDENEQRDEDEEKQDHQHKKYPEYSSGIRFYYHEYYKNNTKDKEILPGTDMIEMGNGLINASYTYSSWYIEPKYGSIKQEVLRGNKVKLSMIEYKNAIIKTNMAYKALRKTIKGAVHLW